MKEEESLMERDEILRALKRESTLRLFFLGVITLGIYIAHYIKRQTAIVNQYLDKEKQISEGLVWTILILTYVSAILFVPYMFVEEGHPIAIISNLAGKILVVLDLVWAFKARNRMNMLLSATKGSEFWFHGLWTFLFTALYFNYKINMLSETFSGQGMQRDVKNRAPYNR